MIIRTAIESGAPGLAAITDAIKELKAVASASVSEISLKIRTDLRRGCSRWSLLNGRDGASYLRKFYPRQGWIERERMANFVRPLAQVPIGSPVEARTAG